MEGSFAMTILIFLGAAIIMAPLVKKLGLSSVIGYIVGGIIIGPFILKLTGKETDNIMHTTEFGVVMLLFLVGLELEPKKFWAMRRKIMGLGLSQMLITIALLFTIFYFAGWKLDLALTVAICFAMSSTAIVLQTLREKHLFKTTAGEASFSTLLFQDIAVIPILAILPVIARYDPPDEETAMTLLLQQLPEWLQPFSVLLGVAILILLGRYVFVPFLRFVSQSNLNELLTAASLFLVIGVSELMVAAGLSPALGAFIAGLMLANSEFRHELESQVDPFKGLLLAVFFVSVGASINFYVIEKDPLFIFTTVVAVLAVKFAVLMGIGKFYKFSMDQNFLYAFALSQVGEFAFVLLNYSSKLYLVSPELNDQLMAVTAITMCITPIMLIVNHRFIDPMFSVKSEDHTDLGIPDNLEPRKIIIVGFGHFGSTVGRLLRANKVRATVLDHDSDRVKLLRSYGFKVYYGDATRLPILRTAGAEEAEILVLCLDDPEDNKLIAEMAKKNFPQLKIYVRAKNRLDAYSFLNNGIDNIYRETLGTAVDMAVDVLHATGMRKYTARRMGKRFEMIDKASVRKLAREQLKEEMIFTTREALQRESELLSYDSISVENSEWIDADGEIKDEQDRP